MSNGKIKDFFSLFGNAYRTKERKKNGEKAAKDDFHGEKLKDFHRYGVRWFKAVVTVSFCCSCFAKLCWKMKFGKRKFAQVSKFTAKWKREKKERMKEGERAKDK